MTGKVVNIDAKGPSAPPNWMKITESGVTIRLSTPSEQNGVKQDSISLRSPTIREVRACQAVHKGDELAVDAMLFASLAEVGEKDILGLTVKDYHRLSSGYFRLVDEDEL
jgi:hypothetical protein